MHIHIDLESIEEASGTTQYLTHPKIEAQKVVSWLEEAAKILQRNNLGSVSITDYNPVVEDNITGRLISEFFYYFCLSLAKK